MRTIYSTRVNKEPLVSLVCIDIFRLQNKKFLFFFYFDDCYSIEVFKLFKDRHTVVQCFHNIRNCEWNSLGRITIIMFAATAPNNSFKQKNGIISFFL